MKQLFWLLLLAVGPLFSQTPDLFDNTRVSNLYLDLPPSQWENLQANYLEDTYYPADLRWESERVAKIGIRSRGNGSRNAVKPGLKLDFSQYTKGQTFLGFKSLDLDNLVQDRSMMRELVAFQLFNKMGISAPREAFVRLFINGHESGLYTVMEPVDKLFLKRALGQDSGYLYDYEWTDEYWFQIRDSYFPVPFTPKTNEKSPDPQPLIELVRTLNESSEDDLPAALAPYLDVRQFLDLFATEVYLADCDGLVGDWGANNFYLYRFTAEKRSIFLPWDRDCSFGLTDRSVWFNVEKNVLTRRLLAIPAYRDYFLHALDRASSVAGETGGWLDREVDRLSTLIRPAATADTRKPYPNSEFEDGVSDLHRFAAERAANIRRELRR